MINSKRDKIVKTLKRYHLLKDIQNGFIILDDEVEDKINLKNKIDNSNNSSGPKNQNENDVKHLPMQV